jgi:hypothetical protein
MMLTRTDSVDIEWVFRPAMRTLKSVREDEGSWSRERRQTMEVHRSLEESHQEINVSSPCIDTE